MTQTLTGNLTGKRAIVCGASKGIGRATAVALANEGVQVTLLARNESALETVKANLAGDSHHVLVADASDIAGLTAKVSAHVVEYGPVHILVNNSGGPAAGPVNQATSDQFLAAFTQHLLANHAMMQAVLEGMKAEGYGRIINVISTSVKMPLKGLGVSNTIRGAVANWAKTLAGEVAGFGITVNNVLPGATDTDRLAEIFEGKAAKLGKTVEQVIESEKAIIPAGRFGAPEELAAAVSFLASPQAAYINGINVPVDGGRTGCL